MKIQGQKRPKGIVVIPSDVNLWPHELKTARTLADAGHVVEFIRRSNQSRQTSSDALIDGEEWEFKAPNGGQISLVEKNLRRGAKQCCNIVFDSHRVKRIPDAALLRELKKWAPLIKGVGRVVFINRHREIIEIR